jgi:hypothetical protein
MIKLILYIISFILGAVIYLFALGGSHGLQLFRLYKREDQIIVFLLFLFWGIPIILLIVKAVTWSIKKIKNEL